MKENKRNGKTAESLEAVHTHTHTHTHTSNSTKRTETIYSTSNSLKNKKNARKQEKVLKSKQRVVVDSVIFTIVFVCIIAIIVGAINSKNVNMQIASVENTEKMQEQEEKSTQKALTIQAGTPNTDNFTYITSGDGYQIPVPKGYVASPVEDERYRDGIIDTSYYLDQTLTLASAAGETYAWTENAAVGAYQSGNYQIASSTSTIETNTFTLSENGVVRINWSVSSQAFTNTDYVYYTITNIATSETIGGTSTAIYGTGNGTAETSLIFNNADVTLDAGTYKVTVAYTKNASIDTGLDRAYVKSIEVYTKSSEGEQIEVREKSGGFVIYEKNANETDQQAIETIYGGNPESDELDEDTLDVAKRTRNQWVWIPISNEEVSRMYHKSDGNIYANTYIFGSKQYTLVDVRKSEPAITVDYDKDNTILKQYLEGISRNELLQKMREEFCEMLKSVATYGGFYIGRYETGNINQKVPVVKKGNNNINNAVWYIMYKGCKNLKGSNKTVQTGMIWGIQWDETLKWILDVKEKSCVEVGGDSVSWGNYTNVSFEYTNESGGTSIKNTGTRIIPTGLAERNKANNIYDLAGNVWEWTMEQLKSNSGKSEYLRVFRGGNYSGYTSSAGPAGYRQLEKPTITDTMYGCRASMYVL